jgi:hypothetical protein
MNYIIKQAIKGRIKASRNSTFPGKELSRPGAEGTFFCIKFRLASQRGITDIVGNWCQYELAPA